MTLLAVVAVGILVTAGAAGGAESAVRVVDRTLACSVAGVGFPDPARYLDVHASPRIGAHTPRVAAWNGSGADGLSAGFHTGPYYGRTTGTLWFSRTQCSATRMRIPLSTAGLRGGQAARFGERYKCDVPARVLLRVRAAFARPVTLRPSPSARYLSVATGKIASASLAVTTVQRKPIAFASVDDATGRAQIFVARSRCFLQ